MEQKTTLIRIGDFFFKYRNSIFPVVLLALFFGFHTRTELLGIAGTSDLKEMVAVIVVAAGLALRGAVIGYRYIKRGGMDKKVYAENLVTDGFFAVCRNPLYVANILIYAGVLLMHGAPEVFVAGMAFFLFVYTAIVAAEEYFLRNGFGDAYREYCKDVPRWGLRLARLHDATQGMTFNLKRALVKDYGAIANGIVSLSLLKLMEVLQWEEPPVWQPFVAIIMVTVAIGLCVRVAKRRGRLKTA